MRQMWDSESEKLLRELYPDTPTVDLVAVFGRSVTKIHQKANRMELRKSEAFLKGPHSGRLDGIIGTESRFQKQMPGWNKGRKQTDYMSAENIARTAATRFKKGQDPHNTVPIGHVRITQDGYMEMKVRHDKSGKNKNFVLVQRLVYEKHFGVIPVGGIIEFRDGNPLNVSPENLELKTRRENMIRNSVSDKAIVKRFLGVTDDDSVMKIIAEMPEIIALKRKTILLNHKINKNYAK